MAVLRTIQGSTPGQLIPLDGTIFVLGRHPECDVVLESGAVSRQHAKIVQYEGRYFLEDLHSRNGTYLNGKLVTQPMPLKESDEIGICDLAFTFHLTKPGAGEAAERRHSAEELASFIDDERASSGSTIMSKIDVVGGQSGTRLQVNTEAKLKALLEISQNLGRAISLNDVLPKLLDSLFKIFIQADRGFIVLKDSRTGRLVPKAIKYRRNEDAQSVRISRTIVNNVMTSKQAILSADAASDKRFDMSESIVDFHIRSMMCAPLVGGDGNALGVIQVDTLDQRNRFNREDLDVLASVAMQAAFAVENAQLHEMSVREREMKRELAVAHEVQRGFLPSASPKVTNYEFFEFYESASELGGDYYDYVPLSGGRLAVVLGDVSGKGISASLLMAKLSAEAKFSLASEPTPAEAMTRLNRVFCGSGWEDRFVTLVMVVLDPIKHEATIVNAGHMPPLLRRGEDDVTPVGEEIAMLPLGVESDVVYEQQAIQLEPGHILSLYTDGITEAMNADGELYGYERLLSRIRPKTNGVAGLGHSILDDVRRFVGARRQSDDMCLTCFGRTQ